MKYCKRCGSEIPDDSIYCPECGAFLSDENPVATDSLEFEEKGTLSAKEVSEVKSYPRWTFIFGVASFVTGCFLYLDPIFKYGGFNPDFWKIVFIYSQGFNTSFGVAGLVFGILSIIKGNPKNKGLAIAGVCLCSVFLVYDLLLNYLSII